MPNNTSPISPQNAKIIGNEIQFLSDALLKFETVNNNFNLRAEIVLGISSAMFLFTFNKVLEAPLVHMGVVIMNLGAIVSAILCLLTIKPPQMMKKKGQTESLLFHTALKKYTLKEYQSLLLKTIQTKEEITKQYALEIYNLTHYSILIKKQFYQHAVFVLVLGLITGFFLTLLSSLFL